MPFVACWPGRIPAGTVRDDPVCLTDVLPTVAAAANVRLPDGAAEDGRDVLAMLIGEGDVGADRPIVHHSLGGRFALRRGRWKAIFSSGSGGGFSEPTIETLFSAGTGTPHPSPPWDAEHPDGQLYDLSADPGETTNLWHAEPGVAAEMYGLARRITRDESNGLPFDVPLLSV